MQEHSILHVLYLLKRRLMPFFSTCEKAVTVVILVAGYIVNEAAKYIDSRTLLSRH